MPNSFIQDSTFKINSVRKLKNYDLPVDGAAYSDSTGNVQAIQLHCAGRGGTCALT